MARKKAEKGQYSNQKKTPDLDCTVCLERQTCPAGALHSG